MGHRIRLATVGCFFLLIMGVLMWRFFCLTVSQRGFLLNQGQARSVRLIDIPAYRGMIVDREGVALAVSTPVQSLWVNPKTFEPTRAAFFALARFIDEKPTHLAARIQRGQNREFIYLKRQLPPMVAKNIEKLHIPGVNFQQEYKRYYPEGEGMAQLLGFTNIDDNGLEGLELAYQDWLMGIPGKKRVVKDRMGRVVDELGILKQPRPGHMLQLSIDRRIQFFAYYELKKTIENFKAQSGSVVVLDAQNGEILAVANYPSYNPNIRSYYTLNSYRNKAITDTFEPGSVMKPFSIASALDGGQFNPHTIIDTRPSYLRVHGHVVRDIHDYGILDVTGVLQKSSNVGVTKMILTVPPEAFIGLLSNAGFGQRTESGYPGEGEGSLVKIKDANPFVLATLAFGYGVSVSALQLAKSFMIFANHGQLKPVHLIHNQAFGEPTQVLKANVADEVLSMMEAVVSKAGGTGKQAEVSGYRVAGKTGTARMAGKNGYEEKRYIASFIGIAPVAKPRLIVAVIIHEPSSERGYYGGAVAAPLFSKVMGASLRILDVPPDQQTT